MENRTPNPRDVLPVSGSRPDAPAMSRRERRRQQENRDISSTTSSIEVEAKDTIAATPPSVETMPNPSTTATVNRRNAEEKLPFESPVAVMVDGVSPSEIKGVGQAEATGEATAESKPETKPKKKKSLGLLVIVILRDLCFTAGIVLGLFVFWQLYVTTWEVSGVTDAAVTSFTKTLAKAPEEYTQERRTDPPPEARVGAIGDTFATLHVPRWDRMTIPVAEGTTAAVLNTGYAGHYTDTTSPGNIGNFSLAGHRRSYGNNFRRVEELQIGDPLVVQTKDAWLVYQVTETQIVLPSQREVINPVPGQPLDTPTDIRMMTLTTCHPEYGNAERFIVHSTLSYWVPRSEGRPQALEGKV
ncbi:MAG: class E sortase [Actinomycetaceae bacterium]|nr:class E sortase [Actinomycetaceae bacterium]